MPAYDYQNKKTEECIRIFCSPEQKETTLKKELDKIGDNPEDWLQVWSLNMSSGGGKTHMGSHTSEGFKDRLRAIKAANPGSTIDV